MTDDKVVVLAQERQHKSADRRHRADLAGSPGGVFYVEEDTSYVSPLIPPPADPSCAHPESSRPTWAPRSTDPTAGSIRDNVRVFRPPRAKAHDDGDRH